jgi:redox-sensing transcriptional repressor
MALTDKKDQKVSLHTVERLSVYRRKLEELSADEVEYIHSHELAALVGVTPAQLRRDLASFGNYGNIARGYDVRRMSRTISQIIGTDRIHNVGLVGVGDLGRALLSYRGFEERGFHITAAFDVDPDKTGRVFAGRRCYPLEKLESVLTDLQIRILILTSRPEGLQEVVDRGVQAGVRSFLNFVPKTLTVPAGCFVEHIDISAKLEKLSFLSRQEGTAVEAAV